jgi:hypothetical protein
MAKPVSINDAALDALEGEYQRTAKPLLAQIRAVTNDPRSQVQRSLLELEAEADRLAEMELRMEADNAYLEKALADYSNAMGASQALIAANDNAIQEGALSLALIAVTAKVFLTLSQEYARRGGNPVSPQALGYYKATIKEVGQPWIVPDALDFATGYVDSPAWINRLNGWGSGYAELTRDTILTGVKSGWGPRFTAAQMRHYAQNLPAWAAENLTRTLQVTAYRDAGVAMESMNGRYVLGKVRIARLDIKTCLSCVALHGTELEPGQRVDDHYRGRCSEFYRVPGGPDFPTYMQADSQPGQRQFVPFQKGSDWFASLPPSRQCQQASFVKVPAKWNAYQAGTPLEAFVGEHQDDVFGRQVIEQSLIGALGEKAREYYMVNQ